MKHKTLIFTLFIFFSTFSYSSTNESHISLQITKMYEHYRTLKSNANTPFEKWLLDMWAFNISSCADKKSEIPREIIKHKVSKSGSYKLINDSDTCADFAEKGFTPHCYQISAYNPPFTKIPKGFHLGQGIFIDSNYNYPLSNSKVFIGAKCLLIKENYKTEQFFSGYATITYDTVTEQYFNTTLGMQHVFQASVFFTINGLENPIGPINMIKLKK